VRAQHPVLFDHLDTDHDDISDLTEGDQDSDHDGIADYLDPFEGSNWLPLQPGSTDPNAYLMQVEPGPSLTVGTHALGETNGGALISAEALATGELFEQYGPDTSFTNVGGFFDFEIHQVAPVGGSVMQVIPLPQAIPAGASYRKLNPDHGWQEFVIDAENRLYSTAGTAGVCPATGDAAYLTGLAEGDHCLMMRIQDGGANDADGRANGTIVDPGGIARPVAAPPEPPATPATDGGGGGGAIFWMLWILTAVGVTRCAISSRQHCRRHRTIS
jgi:hypothetical protein